MSSNYEENKYKNKRRLFKKLNFPIKIGSGTYAFGHIEKKKRKPLALALLSSWWWGKKSGGKLSLKS